MAQEKDVIRIQQMEVLTTIREVRDAIARYRRSAGFGGSVGFVPTMGYLHEGHASLLREARQQCGFVVLSIFVNPLQFGPNEDLSRYPRDTERDLAAAREAGADLVFLPNVEEMYPQPIRTKVSVTKITDVLCGASRPGHFDGVATVVAKLFNIIQPDKAFFGLKDAQQVAVVEQMVSDLNMPVEVVACPTFRDADGLAMSSRNVYLNENERAQASVLSQALELAQRNFDDNLPFGVMKRHVVEHITGAPLARIDYVEILAYPTLEQLGPEDRPSEFGGTIIVALAVKFGNTRLIDNRILSVKGKR